MPPSPFTFAVVGAEPAGMPTVEGVAFVSIEAAERPDALALAGSDATAGPGRLRAQLAGAIGQLDEPLVPVADFTGLGLARADAVADGAGPTSVVDVVDRLRGLAKRIAQLPLLPQSGDRDALRVLALAATRQTDVTAAWDPTLAQLVDYPLLLGIPRAPQQLGLLADLGLLERRFFDRCHECQHCDGSRLNVREECPACRSSHLEAAELVHHYRCAYQGPESGFVSEAGLVCPKCHRLLRHYGVDYDKPGTSFHCRDCGHDTSEPVAGLVCTDCTRHTPGERASSRSWYHYRLTADGRHALMTGRLPRLSFADVLEGYDQAHSLPQFLVLLDHAYRLHRRYDRALSVLRITPHDPDGVRERLGSQSAGEIFDLFLQLLSEQLRLPDSIAAMGSTIVAILPETPPEGAEQVVARLRERMDQVMAVAFPFDAEIFAGDRVSELLEALT